LYVTIEFDSDPFRVAKPISDQLYRENTGTGNCIITWDIIKEQESLSKEEIKHIAPKNKSQPATT
jgi:hypothetical protein